MDKTIIAAILLCTLVAICNANCPAPPKHYTELRCTPIKDEGYDCPNRYECSTLANRDSRKCHFNGNTYEPGSSLSDGDQQLVPCMPACRCMNYSSPASFNCASNECPEFFARRENCVYQYTKGRCCATGPAICGKKIEELGTCYFEGKLYREGETMFPVKDSCYKCHCKEGFDNSTLVGNPNCYEINCGIELRNTERLAVGCIPIYFGNDRCCPIDWRCPDEKDTVVEEVPHASQDPKMQCKFGKLTLGVGDTISSDDSCTTCKCTVPPMAHCIQSRNC